MSFSNKTAQNKIAYVRPTYAKAVTSYNSNYMNRASKSTYVKKNNTFTLQRQLNYIKSKLPHPEFKYFDTTNTSAVITSTPTIYALDAIAQGTTDVDRIGSRVTVRSIFSRLVMTVNATSNFNFLRAIIYSYDGTQGTAPTAAQILQGTPYYLSPLNDDYCHNIKVYSDNTYALAVSCDSVLTDKSYRKCNLDVEYPTGSTASNKNSTYILFVSDQTTNGPSISNWVRLRFTDV